jgi:hypothetical protein
MSLAETVYAARFRSTETIERGRQQALTCPTQRAGATATPTSGTITIYRPDQTVLVTSAVTIPGGGIATYSLAAAATTAEQLGEGWLVEWALVMPDTVTHTFRNDAALCRRTLYPVISDADLTMRHSDLPNLLASGTTSYQSYLDESFATLCNRLISQGRRPFLVIQPSALREAHVALTLHMIFLDFSTSAGDSGRWQALADHYLRAYTEAWNQLRFTYDEADENKVDATMKKGAASTVWLNGRGGQSYWTRWY